MNHAIWPLLSLLLRLGSVFLMMIVLQDLIRALRLNGPIVARLVDVWMAVTFLSLTVVVGAAEQVVDFTPGYDLQQFIYRMAWIPHGVLVVSLWRLYRAFHRETNGKR